MNTYSYTQEQLSAIKHGKGPALVSAGPGAGKTAVLTERVKRLISQNASSVLVITFTKAAAEELKNRIGIVQKKESNIRIGTFHSVFYELLRHFGLCAAASVLSEEERIRLFTECLPPSMGKNTETAKQLLGTYDKIRNEDGDDSVFFDDKGTKLPYYIMEFEKRKREQNVIDFEDMQFMLRDYIQNNFKAIQYISSLYQYILVDEFQDINPVQYEILQQFLSDEKNLFAVGDEDQSIYFFRGSKPEIMLKFKEDFPDSSLYCLYKNFRSGSGIVSNASLFIEKNKFRMSKTFYPALCEKGKVDLLWGKSRNEEFNRVRDWLAALNISGVPFSEMAVLFRTNSQGDYFTRTLRKAGIPFWNHEWNDALIYNDTVVYFLSYLQFSQTGDLNSFKNLMKDNGVLECFREESPDPENLSNISLKTRNIIDEISYHAGRIKTMSIPQAASYIWLKAGGKLYCEKLCEKNFIPEYLMNTVLKKIFEQAEQSDSYTELKNKLNKSENKGIFVGTFHSAKGLEFDSVACIEIMKDIIPHWKSTSEQEIEEERRLLYVGMTRAKNNLLISGHGDSDKNESVFYQEIKKIIL